MVYPNYPQAVLLAKSYRSPPPPPREHSFLSGVQSWCGNLSPRRDPPSLAKPRYRYQGPQLASLPSRLTRRTGCRCLWAGSRSSSRRAADGYCFLVDRVTWEQLSGALTSHMSGGGRSLGFSRRFYALEGRSRRSIIHGDLSITLVERAAIVGWAQGVWTPATMRSGRGSTDFLPSTFLTGAKIDEIEPYSGAVG